MQRSVLAIGAGTLQEKRCTLDPTVGMSKVAIDWHSAAVAAHGL